MIPSVRELQLQEEVERLKRRVYELESKGAFMVSEAVLDLSVTHDNVQQPEASLSIHIHNIGGDPLGISEYALCIDDRNLTTFKHDRTKGLAECLREAAKAMDCAQWEMIEDYVTDIPPDIAKVIAENINKLR